MVEFSFEDFRVSAEKDERYLTAFEVSLLGLRAEDLTQAETSPSRFFLKSLTKGGEVGRGGTSTAAWNFGGDRPTAAGRKRRMSTLRDDRQSGIQNPFQAANDNFNPLSDLSYLSTSCPNASVYLPPTSLSTSLPDKLDPGIFFPYHHQEKRKKKMGGTGFPGHLGGEPRTVKSKALQATLAIPQTPPPSPFCETPRKMSLQV